MKLIISGRQGMRLCSWESYVLLRDSISIFIEGQQPCERFRTLHSVAQAGDGPLAVDAVRLRLEVLRAWSALWRVRQEYRASRSDGQRHVRSPLPGTARQFLRAALSLTRDAVSGDKIRLRRLDAKSGTTGGAPSTGPSGHVSKWLPVLVLCCCCSVGCASLGTSANPDLPRAPVVRQHKEPQAHEAETNQRDEPRIVAPPPAYGNKIVRGSGADGSGYQAQS